MLSPYIAYSSRARAFVEATRDIDMSELYGEFLPYIDEHGSILDIGAGSGRDSKEFLRQGLTVVALEPDEELAKLASEYIGQPVVQETIQRYVPESGERFNGIWASASLLHIPLQELTRVFCRLSYIMKPGGALYVSFKYGSEFVKEKNGLYYTYLDEVSFDEYLPKMLFRYQRVWVTEDRRADQQGERWLNVVLRYTGVDGPFDEFWKSIGRRHS
jgi:SAM-dependent methyltransferase